MNSATAQSTKIDIIVANIARFTDIPFRELSFGVDSGGTRSSYVTTGLQNALTQLSVRNSATWWDGRVPLYVVAHSP